MPFDFSHTAFLKADEIIRDVARQKNAQFIDAAKLLSETDKNIYFDHVHLTDYGSNLISNIVGDKIKELILSEQNQNIVK